MDKNQRNNVPLLQKNLPLLFCLMAAGLAGNYFRFNLFLNIEFLFGSIFALLALQFYGVGRGVLAGVVISSYTYILWTHPYAIIIMTAEVAVVGWLNRRRQMSLVLADALYWLCLGMPLVYLFYHGVMQVPAGNASIIMVKQSLNGIANALAAWFLFIVFALRSTKVSFRELTCNLLLAFVLFPALLTLGIDGRSEFTETDQKIRQSLRHDSRQLADSLEVWTRNRSLPIIALAELAQRLSPAQMQARLEQTLLSDRNFFRVALLDREANTIAFAPLVDELGRSNIGRNYADRPFIPQLKQTLKPMLSEVVIARAGLPKPTVHVLVPVVDHGRYNGYALGALNLQRVRDIFRINALGTQQLYTLLDKNGKVIATNRPGQQTMTPLDRGKGELKPIDGSISQWMPALPPNTPKSERWTKSSYVAETSIGDLAEWRLILEQPVAPFQASLYHSYTRKMVILFLMLLGSMALAELVSRKVLTSLQKLQDVTSGLPAKIATDAAITWPVSGIRETDRLITNFRAMAGSLAVQFGEIRQINDQLEERIAERTGELHESETFTRDVLDSLTAHIAVLDREGDIVLVNDAWRRFGRENGRGDDAANDSGKHYLAICRESIGKKGDDGAQMALAGIEAVLGGQRQRFSLEYPCHSPTERRWFIMRVSALQGKRAGVVISHADITDRRQSEDQLKLSLGEKEVLLKEIHHRVKNNMQVIHSLLNLQAKAVKDKSVRALFNESRDRVKSMVLIHERLYRSADLAHIDFRDYCQSLVREIFSSYQRPGIDFALEIQEIFLDVTSGIPCGLIINELVSNALKYAFPRGGTGTVRVGMEQRGNDNYCLTVEDNGVGLPAGLDFQATGTLGLQLVMVLAEQLNGTVELETGTGTLFRIVFPPHSQDRREYHG